MISEQKQRFAAAIILLSLFLAFPFALDLVIILESSHNYRFGVAIGLVVGLMMMTMMSEIRSVFEEWGWYK